MLVDPLQWPHQHCLAFIQTPSFCNLKANLEVGEMSDVIIQTFLQNHMVTEDHFSRSKDGVGALGLRPAAIDLMCRHRSRARDLKKNYIPNIYRSNTLLASIG